MKEMITLYFKKYTLKGIMYYKKDKNIPERVL